MMNMKKTLALLLAAVMVLGMFPFGAMADETVTHLDTCLEGCTLEDCACACHAQPVAPAAEEPKQEQPTCTCTPADDGTHAETCALYVKPEAPASEEPKQETPVCTCTPAEDGTHAETCALYEKPVTPAAEEPKQEQPTCTCTPAEDGTHAETCALYEKPQEPKPEEPKQEQPQPEQPKQEEPKQEQPTCTCTPAEDGTHAETCALYEKPQAPVCTCTPTEDGIHAETCALYEKPEEPVCTCTPVDGVHVEGCALYEEPEETTTEPTVIVDFEELYARFMVCVSVSEVDAIYADMTEEEAVAFLDALSEEQRSALLNHFAELGEAEAEVGFDPVTPAVNFTNAASFGAPVKGQAARSTFSLRRTMAMAAAVDGENDNGLEVWKTVSAPDTEGKYTLTLEAWTTGEKTITSVSSTKPTDIILVLDQSGSMNFCMYANCNNQQCNGNHGNSGVTYTAVYDIQENGTYYRIRNGQYIRVYYCDGYDSKYDYYDCEAGWYTEEHGDSYYQHDGTQLTPKTSANSSGTQFYVQNTSSNQTYPKRLAALKDAVTIFANSVAEKAKGTDGILNTDDDVNHTISVVGFARGTTGESQSDYYLNTEVFIGNRQYKYGTSATNQYTNVPQDMDTEEGVANVMASIGALAAEGATRVDLGIEMANGILAANPIPEGQERNRVVIVFTDGSPASSSSYNETVANNAINNANTTINTHQATVYSIGIFGGANGTNPGTLPDNNSTGSNRENRFMHLVSSNYKDAISMTRTGSVNPDLASGESYYLSASDSNALNDIFETISQNIESGGTTTKLDESTIVKDIIADSFKLPDGADQNSIKVYTDGVNSTTGEFNNSRTEYAATVSISGKDISVTNFDFSENWVGSETDASGNVTWRGQKLIIEIPIVPNPDFLGGNNVPTNGEASGVYSGGELVEAFKAQKTDVSIKLLEIGVATTDQNIYLTNDADLAKLVTGLDHRINGANNAYVDITYQIKDGDTVVGTVLIPAGQKVPATLTWTPAENQDMTPGLEADKTYTIVATATPTSSGTYDATTNTETEPVNVFKPVITWKDSQINAGQTPDYEGRVADVDDNLVSVIWKHDETLSTEKDKDGKSIMSGTEPVLSYTFDPDAQPMSVDTPVDVTVLVGTGEEKTDITSHVTFVHENCDFDGCKWLEAKEDGKEFIVHIKSFDLTIYKTGVAAEDAGAPFVVNVKCDATKIDMDVVLYGEDHVTIKGLPSGTYIITETSGYWRYDLTQAVYKNADGSVNQTREVKPSGATASITIENKRTNDKWLDDWAKATNNFGGSASKDSGIADN